MGELLGEKITRDVGKQNTFDTVWKQQENRDVTNKTATTMWVIHQCGIDQQLGVRATISGE